MIKYVFGKESEYTDHINDNDWDDNNDTYMLTAEEQEWDPATIKQLRDEYDIIFNDGVHPILVLNKSTDHPLLVVGYEDDGTLFFYRKYGEFINCFSPYWVETLYRDLVEAKKLAGCLQG